MIPFSIERVREGFELSTLRVVLNASNSATTDRMATHIIKIHRPQGNGKTSSSRYVGYGTTRTKRHLDWSLTTGVLKFVPEIVNE
jgi:hypothetical protein